VFAWIDFIRPITGLWHESTAYTLFALHFHWFLYIIYRFTGSGHWPRTRERKLKCLYLSNATTRNFCSTSADCRFFSFLVFDRNTNYTIRKINKFGDFRTRRIIIRSILSFDQYVMWTDAIRWLINDNLSSVHKVLRQTEISIRKASFYSNCKKNRVLNISNNEGFRITYYILWHNLYKHNLYILRYACISRKHVLIYYSYCNNKKS